MKSLFIFFALLTIAIARPAVELVPDADMPHLITEWHRYHYTHPKPVRIKPSDQDKGLITDDVILWETYVGQPINPGDLYIADYPTKNFYDAIRECKNVTSTTVTTLAGTTIPLSQVKGVVIRVIRVVQIDPAK